MLSRVCHSSAFLDEKIVDLLVTIHHFFAEIAIGVFNATLGAYTLLTKAGFVVRDKAT
jgi:hypothetical protein